MSASRNLAFPLFGQDEGRAGPALQIRHYRLILALEERGFIRRLPNRARALEVLRLPKSSTPPGANRTRKFSPSVIEGNLGRVRPLHKHEEEMEGQQVAIPVIGRIAAGTPIRRSSRAATPLACRRICFQTANISRSRCAAIR